ncbi:ATP synthase F1 subunit delta [Balneola sp. MJW-20]|uniref:ATP synthase F1 subunit delta n=1 Tax=Gracilimonas aurantiaca TaxID=3234185 RepID=UPI003466A262
MLVSKAAKRYASALIDIAKEDKILDVILEDVKMTNATIQDSKDLTLFLNSPIIKPDQKQKALEAIFADKVHKLLFDFLRFVASKNRGNIIPQIMDSFIAKYEEMNGIINVEVRSASKLSDKQLNQLSDTLAKNTGKKIQLHTLVNPELKGGLAVKIDDTVIDGTIKHKLEKLEDQFLASAGE